MQSTGSFPQVGELERFRARHAPMLERLVEELTAASSIARASVREVTRVNFRLIGVLLTVLLMLTCVPLAGRGMVQVFYRGGVSGPRCRDGGHGE